MDLGFAPVLVPSEHRLEPAEPAGETRSGAETLNPHKAEPPSTALLYLLQRQYRNQVKMIDCYE